MFSTHAWEIFKIQNPKSFFFSPNCTNMVLLTRGQQKSGYWGLICCDCTMSTDTQALIIYIHVNSPHFCCSVFYVDPTLLSSDRNFCCPAANKWFLYAVANSFSGNKELCQNHKKYKQPQTINDTKTLLRMKDGNRLKVLERDATAHCVYIQPVKHWINHWEEAHLIQ